jgi:uncharacterized membrane protein YkvA (DUF1232 family)
MARSGRFPARYIKIPLRSLAAILAALTWFLSPFDLICDFIPVIGYLDDIFVIGLALKLCHDDLREFKAWRAEQGMEKGDESQVPASA